MKRSRVGFTIVELIVVVTVIGILAGILIIGYGAWQHKVADANTQSDLQQGTTGLKSYQNFSNDYPPNLGGVGFASSSNVVLKLSTNSPQIRVYTGLTAAQNAQLFLNTCNALMPITSGGTTYNTSCSFSGVNIHVAGTSGSNIVWQGPTIQQSDVVLTCGPACTTAAQTLLTEFTSQGGTFPISPPGQDVSLPAYSTQNTGTATRFCLEGDSALYTDIAYHTTSESSQVVSGPCPNDPTLHYP
ncbi:MAG TPA: prepilin-type N-terminal cleavage/methylation domain-containing protein [Dongiaceae bacterium]|nr:prepilin-type N-terminal cleavage/methylation domain-containing protein [Dongiaceae bacterium]